MPKNKTRKLIDSPNINKKRNKMKRNSKAIIINNKDDAYSSFNENLKEDKIPLSIKGLNLPEEDTKRLETQIHQMISKEVKRHLSQELEKARSENEIAKAQNRIIVSLADLNLPEEDTKRLETQIHQMISKEVKEDKGGQNMLSNRQSTTCVYTVYVPGRRSDPGTWSLPPAGTWGTLAFPSEDIIDVWWNHSTLPINQMWVGIKTSGRVSWRKELIAWHGFYGRITATYVEGFNTLVKWMKIYKADCFTNTDTLVLRKAQFLGWMVDKYNLGDGYNFWRIFGGKQLVFNWRYDGSS
jgi:hypothetical protein